MLRAGHNIASSQKEYQGIDFRKVSWEYLVCRGKRNPTFCCGAPGEDRQRLRCNMPLKCQHCALRASMFHSVLFCCTTCHALCWQGDVSRSTPLPSAQLPRALQMYCSSGGSSMAARCGGWACCQPRGSGASIQSALLLLLCTNRIIRCFMATSKFV